MITDPAMRTRKLWRGGMSRDVIQGVLQLCMVVAGGARCGGGRIEMAPPGQSPVWQIREMPAGATRTNFYV